MLSSLSFQTAMIFEMPSLINTGSSTSELEFGFVNCNKI